MTVKVGVIGYPVAHSLSPFIHNYWIREHGLDAEYQAIQVKPEHLRTFILNLEDQGFAGVNVTVPYKEKVLQYLDKVARVVKLIGAVNTIVVDKGVVKGTNTDMYGFTRNLQEKTEGVDFSSAKAVVLGAGGAARAICPALLEKKLNVREVVIFNRTVEKADSIKKHHEAINPQEAKKLRVAAWEEMESELKDAGLFINTTTLGMKGQLPLHVRMDALPQEAVVVDIVYNPLETAFLKQARVRGLRTVDGLGMLLHQAAPAFREWFDILPEVTPKLRKMVESRLQ